jgi:hypothetical protein
VSEFQWFHCQGLAQQRRAPADRNDFKSVGLSSILPGRLRIGTQGFPYSVIECKCPISLRMVRMNVEVCYHDGRTSACAAQVTLPGSYTWLGGMSFTLVPDLPTCQLFGTRCPLCLARSPMCTIGRIITRRPLRCVLEGILVKHHPVYLGHTRS